MRFSVVIPTYNRAGLIFKTIESALAQTFGDFEIIVVDDGSTDETPKLFESYRHPKVRYYRVTNRERGAARNYGARQAQGEYLNFFDSDDLMMPAHLEEADRCIRERGRPEVFALGYQIEDDLGRAKQVFQGLPDPLNELLLENNLIGCNPVFVRKDVFERLSFNEARALAGSEDWLLWLRLAARFPFRFRDRVTSRLIDHQGRSVYHFKEEDLEGRARALHEALLTDPEFMAKYGGRLLAIRAYRQIYTGLHLALSGHVRLPLKYLGRAAATSPRTLWRRATLGTLKHVLQNVIRLTVRPARRT